jgi:hypothetical protein
LYFSIEAGMMPSSNDDNSFHSGVPSFRNRRMFRVARRSGFRCFVPVSRKTFSGRKNVPVFKNSSIAHNESNLIGLICAKIIHVYKLSLKSQ